MFVPPSRLQIRFEHQSGEFAVNRYISICSFHKPIIWLFYSYRIFIALGVLISAILFYALKLWFSIGLPMVVGLSVTHIFRN